MSSALMTVQPGRAGPSLSGGEVLAAIPRESEEHSPCLAAGD